MPNITTIPDLAGIPNTNNETGILSIILGVYFGCNKNMS